MRIVHLALGKANPHRPNGVSKVVHYLANEQVQLGWDVEVWGLTPSPAAPTPPRNYNLRLFRHDRQHPDPRILDAVDEVPTNTLFHLHGGFILEFAVVGARLRRRGLRYVVTPHGALAPVALSKNRWLKSLYWTILEKPLLAGATAVHVLAPPEESMVSTLLPEAKVVRAPNGQSLEDLDFAPMKFDGPSRPLFGYCGRIDSNTKGLDLLVNGFLDYANRSNEGVLWIIGDGVDRRVLEVMAGARLAEKRIVFWGSKFAEEKRALISCLDVFFQPSRHEGFPTGPLEAAALGRPLAVSRQSNLGEYVERHGAGWMLDPLEARSVAEVMRAVACARREGKLARIGQNARAMVEGELSSRAVCSQLFGLYGA